MLSSRHLLLHDVFLVCGLAVRSAGREMRRAREEASEVRGLPHAQLTPVTFCATCCGVRLGGSAGRGMRRAREEASEVRVLPHAQLTPVTHGWS